MKRKQQAESEKKLKKKNLRDTTDLNFQMPDKGHD